MRAKTLLSLVALMGMLASTALAQQGRDDELQQLRQRLQELERQADRENGVSRRRRPVEIGSRTRVVEPRTLIRIYDLGDLFVIAPAYEAQRLSDLLGGTAPLIVQPQTGRRPAATVGGFGGGGGGMGGGGGGFFNIGSRSRVLPDKAKRTLHQADGVTEERSNRLSLEDLVNAIQDTIAPDTWDTAGGGKITTLGTSLIVSAEEQVHQQVEALLAQIRERWGTVRTVTVRAYWVWLTDAELAQLIGDDGHGTVDRVKFQQRLAEVNRDDERPGGYSASITCYNGQTVHVVSGGQSLVVTGVVPIVTAESVGYQPVISMVQEGAVLQVTPTASTSGKYVVIDVHSRVSQLRERGVAGNPVEVAVKKVDEQGEAVEEKRTVEAFIDRPLLMNHRLSTTLRVPVDQPVLVGGMTFESAPAPGEPNLYLFVETSVRELKDESEEAAADTKGEEN